MRLSWGAAGNLDAFCQRGAVQRVQFGVERAPGFVHDPGKNATQAVQIVGMNIDVVDGRRQRGVVKGLQPFAHVADDFENNFTRGY